MAKKPTVLELCDDMTTQLTLLYALDAAVLGLEEPQNLLCDKTTNIGMRALLADCIHGLEHIHSDLRDLAPPPE
jgi:hypothetical protein